VSQEVFQYATIPKGETFTIPDDYVGRKSKPNQAETSQTLTEGRTEDHALDGPVPNVDVEQAPEGVDLKSQAAEHVASLIQLKKETLAAALVFGATNYTNKVTLSGTTQWSHASSDPLKAILVAMDTMVMRPNILVIGQEVFTQLILHPKIIAAMHANEGQYGKASVGFLATLLGLDRVLVGGSWYNTAAPGQTVSLSRAWGKHAALLHYNPNAVANYATTWGACFVWPYQGQDLFSGTIDDPDMGSRGGTRVRVGMNYICKLIATDFGYLFVNAVA
jgi:hypothetical protein